MSGKATFILIIGFTLIFLVMGYFWGSLATRSVDNHVSYYKTTVAHNIAVSGANIALQEVIADSQWVSDIDDRPFENGLMNVDLTSLGPPVRMLTSTGSFMGVDQIVKVKLMRDQTSLAKYAWFIPSVSTGSKPQKPWITGDSVWGGFHSNQFLVVNGDPVFFGRVTTLKGIQATPGSNPQFLGGYAEGISVSWEMNKKLDIQKEAAIEGQSEGGTCYFDNKIDNLWLTFNSDGTVTYRTDTKNSGGDSSKYSAPVTIPLGQMAPNGIIYVNSGDIYMSGVLNGKVTVVADGASGWGGPGNVYLVGDMVNNIDPMIPNGSGGYTVNPASLDENGDPLDMMGIIARNNITIATSVESGGWANNVTDPDINIDGGIICLDGGFTVQNLNSMPGPRGNINLQGSMVASKEESVANFDGLNITQGYNRHVIFDERFAIGPPTWFPYLTYYRVISWLE